MTKPSLTTIEHEVDEADMADAQFTGYYIDAAMAEAKMLVERNEPFIPCSEWTGTWYQRACVLECGESARMLGALAEALAAFVAD